MEREKEDWYSLFFSLSLFRGVMEGKKLARVPVRDVAGLSEWRTSDGVSALRNEVDYCCIIVDYPDFCLIWFKLNKLRQKVCSSWVNYYTYTTEYIATYCSTLHRRANFQVSLVASVYPRSISSFLLFCWGWSAQHIVEMPEFWFWQMAMYLRISLLYNIRYTTIYCNNGIAETVFKSVGPLRLRGYKIGSKLVPWFSCNWTQLQVCCPFELIYYELSPPSATRQLRGSHRCGGR